MNEPEDPGRTRDQARREADRLEQGRIAQVGVDLMNRYNRDLRDPSVMASLGHDSMFGYEFSIQRDGVTYLVEVRRDMAE